MLNMAAVQDDKRYGGIDALLVWATYPNMGIDDRNQQDMLEVLPA
jgi:gamma-glutamyl hercynylcysteine S-oxide synthase